MTFSLEFTFWTDSRVARVESSEDFATCERSASGILSIPARMTLCAASTFAEVASPVNLPISESFSSSSEFHPWTVSISGRLDISARMAFCADVTFSEVANPVNLPTSVRVASLARIESSEDFATSERSTVGILSMLLITVSFTEFNSAEVASPVNLPTSVRVASFARGSSSEDFATSERSASGMASMLSRISFFAEFKLSEVANV